MFPESIPGVPHENVMGYQDMIITNYSGVVLLVFKTIARQDYFAFYTFNA